MMGQTYSGFILADRHKNIFVGNNGEITPNICNARVFRSLYSSLIFLGKFCYAHLSVYPQPVSVAISFKEEVGIAP